MPEDPSARRLRLRLLGPPQWDAGAGPVPLHRLDAAWIAPLAIDGPAPRERLAAWLWPDAAPRNAALNLRQRIFKLRQATGHPLVDGTATLRLAPGVEVDTAAPPDGPLLGTLDYDGLDALSAWLRAARERLARERLDRRIGEAARLEAEGALAPAIALVEAIVAEAPWHEHSWRRLMRLHYLRGDRTAAIAAFERLEREVLAEIGARPTAETLALLETVERSTPPALAGAGALPASLLRPPVLVGREAELRTMAEAWAAGRALLLLGEGGIGKSRLLAEFAAAHPGLRLVRARPGDAGMPYATLRAWLEPMLAERAPPLAPAARAELARVLPALGPAAAGPGDQGRLWSAIEALLAAAQAQGEAGVALDDLHCADAATLELLRWLAASPALAGLRFLFAARPADGGPADALLAAWAADSTRLLPLRLGPLPAAPLRALVQSLGLPGVDAALADALLRHAGGHPFFTLETLKARWLDRGRDGAALPHPPAAGALIAHRLQRLDPAARDLLRVAALAGPPLDLPLLAQVLGRAPLALADAWRALEAAQVLAGDGFAHDLVREAALAEVPAALAALLHGQIADALQARGGAAPARLAAHRLAAGQWAAAAAAFRAAAEQARGAGRLPETQALLHRAAAAWGRAGEAEAAFDARCDAAELLQLREGSDALLAEAGRLAADAPSPGARARVHALAADALLNLARYAPALDEARQALALAGSGPTRPRAQRLLAHGLAATGRPDEAVALLAPEAGPDASLDTLAALAHAHHAAGRLAEALHWQQRAVARAEQDGGPGGLAQACANLASVANTAGRLALAWEAACRADALFTAMSARGGLHGAHVRVLRAACAVHLGRLDDAHAAVEPLCRERPQDISPTMHLLAHAIRLALWTVLGRADRLDAAPPPSLAAAHPLAQASYWVSAVRARRVLGGDDAGALAALRALGEAHPALRDEPTLALSWCRFDPPAEGLARLEALFGRAGAAGQPALRRAVRLRRLELRLATGPAAAVAAEAADLAAALDEDLPAAVQRPEAAWLLHRVLRETDPALAARCLAAAQDHLARTRLPSAEHRAAFEAHPLHAAILASATARP